MEQQKLAHKLERACSPTQDVAEFLDGEFSEEEEDIDYDAMEKGEEEQPQVYIIGSHFKKKKRSISHAV